MKQLRSYQEDIITKIRESFRKGNRRILVQLPTGGGKSVIFSKLIASSNKKLKSTLFMVHRRELILQASQHMVEEEIEHGIIMAKVRPSLTSLTQLASIQTLWSRCHTYNKQPFPVANLIVLDEAHHAGSKMYDGIMRRYPDAVIIGVTATPCRKGGIGLGDCFDDLIIGASVRELTDKGYLAKAEYMIPNVPNLKGIKTLAGDYVEIELAVVMNEAKIMGSILEHYQKYAIDKKTIIFAVNIAHSLAILESFTLAGISIAHIDGTTPIEERQKILHDYELGKFSVLTNVGIFTEGVDMPDVDCIVLAKPTKSLGLYLQMCGRGLRPKKYNGKCLILDHTGNYYRHGAVDEWHDWNLDPVKKIQDRDRKKDKKKDKVKQKEFACSSCGAIFSGRNTCPKCGTELGRNSKDVEFHKGELIKSETPPKKEISFDEMDIWHGMLLKYANDKEYKPGWVHYKFQAKFGKPPDKGFSDIQLLPDAGFKKYIQYLNIRAAKGAQKRKIKL